MWTETSQCWGRADWQRSTLHDTATFLVSIGISSCACVMASPAPFDPAAAAKKRVMIYHQVQLVERLARRLLHLSKKADDKGHAMFVLMPHLKWTVPVVVRILRCIHSMVSPDGRKLLGTCESVLALGEVERAFMLGITPTGVSPSAYVSVATTGAQSFPSSATNATMEADNTEALRIFVRGVRDSIYQFLGTASQLRVGDQNLAMRLGFSSFFDGMASMAPEIYAVIVEHAQYHDDRCMKMMLRSFICPMVRSCPANMWRPWLGGILPPFLEHMHTRLTSAWHAHLTGQPQQTLQSQQQQQQQQAKGTGGGGPGSQGEMGPASAITIEQGEEILQEMLMRELTREHLALLLVVASGEETGNFYFQRRKGQTQATPNANVVTAFQWLASDLVQTAATLLATVVASITWPDSETGAKAIKACRIAVGMSRGAPGGALTGLQAFIAHDMFTGLIASLTLSSHADIQAEILLVIRDIIARYQEHVSAILLGLPNIDVNTLKAFFHGMQTRGAEKDQRNLVRKLLLRSGGSELKALAQSHQPGCAIPQLQSTDFNKRSAQGHSRTNPALLDTVGQGDQAPLAPLFHA